MAFRIGKTLQIIGLVEVAFGLYYGIAEGSEMNELIAMLIGVAFFGVGTLLARKKT